MQPLTPYAQSVVADIANRYGVSQDAVITLLVAVNNGGGTQAQFSHPELGGMGQWSSGGMTMVGDMFNNGLKFTVSGICGELSSQLAQNQMFPPAPKPAYASSQGQSQSQSSGGFGSGTSFSVQVGYGGGSSWPAELGQPSSTGSQNNLRYAVFPQARRLAIDLNGQITVYDIGDHQIGGFSQQQGGDQSITFTSQYGTVRVADLPVVSPGGPSQAPAPSFDAPQSEPQTAPQPVQANAPSMSSDEVFSLIEKLADLHAKGILSDSDYETKKAELLSRL
ncbi:hypothetical protein DKT77_01465 [Meridianimarinicoccus roseus]|uniref:SHOCT domain-containing protein n=1 Tax=Meridianimarinicoccus roseus TaxID=2072018 RepID=A0A2V2LFY3_9RHOB|nr:SHOCT domain-containing protein [Meridianimarinicoccus roseus]PWR04375.1 hypothetical protein DKT77_01465 [Meridianimarinicoccus roseus]